jgi:RNA polymerase sigma-70 factor (ECF subfamily)
LLWRRLGGGEKMTSMAPETRDDAGAASAAKRYFELGRAALPGVGLDYGTFERHLARHPPLEREDRAPDMYLACACAEGTGPALVELEAILRGVVARALGSVDSSPHFVEEVLQVTRARVLVSRDGQPAKIASYAGRASLKSWLCAVASRAAVDQKRRRMAVSPRPSLALDPEPLAVGDPEFEYLRTRYKEAFESAVRAAIERLTPKQRLLLRLNAVDGVSIDRLGDMYNVGRSTAARWLAQARRELFEHTRQKLQGELRLTTTELESLARVMRSHIDVSILKLLGR